MDLATNIQTWIVRQNFMLVVIVSSTAPDEHKILATRFWIADSPNPDILIAHLLAGGDCDNCVLAHSTIRSSPVSSITDTPVGVAVAHGWNRSGAIPHASGGTISTHFKFCWALHDTWLYIVPKSPPERKFPYPALLCHLYNKQHVQL